MFVGNRGRWFVSRNLKWTRDLSDVLCGCAMSRGATVLLKISDHGSPGDSRPSPVGRLTENIAGQCADEPGLYGRSRLAEVRRGGLQCPSEFYAQNR